ncbi:hypothetical protein SAMN02745243_02669 [Hespellia stercorisuis DSM 15480]|uniref:Uncharacterized protein n=2 Tax=Hespellia stercorisuis TaxID=180311 RepID=A0A1M6REH3_9FIRM|nr:hypothetical protein SAMN02745243_02669 [Hespellia stercorisuis DSM 15480]
MTTEEAMQKQMPKKPVQIIKRMNGYIGACAVCGGHVLRVQYWDSKIEERTK